MLVIFDLGHLVHLTWSNSGVVNTGMEPALNVANVDLEEMDG
jgi:hypothetical protein